MPEPLRKFFGLRRLRASELGITELEGQKLRGDEWLQPRISVLPMGWSWALYWCQMLHQRVADQDF